MTTQSQRLRADAPFLLLFLSLAGLVLLISCGNVARLLIARGEARRRELAIRAALGAGRTRIARQLLAEGMLLSFAGAGLGLLFTRWFIVAEPSFMPPGPFQIGPVMKIDGRLLLFTLSVSVVATIAFSLAPTLQGIKLRPLPQPSFCTGVLQPQMHGGRSCDHQDRFLRGDSARGRPLKMLPPRRHRLRKPHHVA